MRIATLTLAYNEGRMIEPCLRQIPEWVEKKLLLISEKPWNGPQSNVRHETWEKLPDLEGLKVYKLPWPTEEAQRNWGIGHLSDFDWVIILDADEFYTPEDWERLRHELKYSLS